MSDESPGLYLRCGATTTSGYPCKRAAYPGGTRCNLHGGASPQAKAVADLMLARARLPAIEALHSIIHDYMSDTCETCGRPTGDPSHVIRTAQLVLDRTGMHPTLAVQATQAGPPDYLRWLTREQLDQITVWMHEAKASMRRGDPLPAADPILLDAAEGEVVETAPVGVGSFAPGNEPQGDL